MEALEDRTVLTSALSYLSPVTLLSSLISDDNKDNRLALNGTVHGSYTNTLSNPDAGRTYVLSGSGNVRPLRGVEAQGTLTAPGFVAHGRTSGTLILTDAHGTLTLRLRGGPQRGFSSLPQHFHFSILHISGRLPRKPGGGTAILTLDQAAGALGAFTLRLHSSA
jgi:hypothetical protein